MTAARLRKVGNLGVLIDPGAVEAILRPASEPGGVDLVLGSGVRLQVFTAAAAGRPAGTRCDQADVDHVWAQLNQARESPPTRPRPGGR